LKHALDGGAHWRNLANTVESLMCGGNAAIFGRPFVKRFALCYQTVVCLSCLSCLSVCLSLTLAYCGQTVGWIKLKLGMQVGLGPGHMVLDGNPAPPERGINRAAQFSARICCCQMAAWIKMPLGRQVCLGQATLCWMGTQLPSPKMGQSPLIFGPCLL